MSQTKTIPAEQTFFQTTKSWSSSQKGNYTMNPLEGGGSVKGHSVRTRNREKNSGNASASSEPDKISETVGKATSGTTNERSGLSRWGTNPEKARKGIEELYGSEFAKLMMMGKKEDNVVSPANSPKPTSEGKSPDIPKPRSKNESRQKPSVVVPNFALSGQNLAKETSSTSPGPFPFGKRTVPSVPGPVSGSFVFGTSILGAVDKGREEGTSSSPLFQFEKKTMGKPGPSIPKGRTSSQSVLKKPTENGRSENKDQPDVLQTLRKTYSESNESPAGSPISNSRPKESFVFFSTEDNPKPQNHRYADLSEDSVDSQANRSENSVAEAMSKLTVEDKHEATKETGMGMFGKVEELRHGLAGIKLTTLQEENVDELSKSLKGLRVKDTGKPAEQPVKGRNPKENLPEKNGQGKGVRPKSSHSPPLHPLNIGRHPEASVAGKGPSFGTTTQTKQENLLGTEGGENFQFSANGSRKNVESKKVSSSKQTLKTPKARKSKSVRQNKKTTLPNQTEGPQEVFDENLEEQKGESVPPSKHEQEKKEEMNNASENNKGEERKGNEAVKQRGSDFKPVNLFGAEPKRNQDASGGTSSQFSASGFAPFGFFGHQFTNGQGLFHTDTNPFAKGEPSPLFRSSGEPILFQSVASPDSSRKHKTTTAGGKDVRENKTPISAESVFVSSSSFGVTTGGVKSTSAMEDSPMDVSPTFQKNVNVAGVEKKMGGLSLKKSSVDKGMKGEPTQPIFGKARMNFDRYKSDQYGDDSEVSESKPESSGLSQGRRDDGEKKDVENSPLSANSYASAQDTLTTPESVFGSPVTLKFNAGTDTSLSKSLGKVGSPGVRRSQRLRSSISKTKSPAKAKLSISESIGPKESLKEPEKPEGDLPASVQASAGPSTSALVAEQSCEKWRTKGNVAYNQGNYHRAEDFYGRGIESVGQHLHIPRCARSAMLCWSNRAATRVHLSRVHSALEDCQKAMKVDPTFIRVRLRAANCNMLMGSMKEATSILHECLITLKEESGADAKLIPEAQEGLRKVRLIEELQRKADESLRVDPSAALRLLTEALNYSSYNEALWMKKANILLQLRKYDEVIKLCESTFEKAKNNEKGSIMSEDGVKTSNCQFWRWRIIGKATYGQGKLEESLQFFEKCLTTQREDENEAVEGVKEQISNIKRLLSLKAKGNDSFQAGSHGDAVEHYSSALNIAIIAESRPFMAVCFCNRAAANQALGLITDAIADCSRAIALEPTYAKAVSRRATLHELLRDYSQSSADLSRLLQLLEESGKGSSSDASKARERMRKADESGRKGFPVDHYALLGLESGCTPVDVKKAFRKAALRHHPDKAAQILPKGGEDSVGRDWKEVEEEAIKESDKLFKLIGEAYAVLSDPVKKQQYDTDEQLRKLQRNGGSGQTGSSGMYGGTYGRAGRRGRDVWDEWDSNANAFNPGWNQSESFSRRTRGHQAGPSRGSSRYSGFNWNDL